MPKISSCRGRCEQAVNIRKAAVWRKLEVMLCDGKLLTKLRANIFQTAKPYNITS